MFKLELRKNIIYHKVIQDLCVGETGNQYQDGKQIINDKYDIQDYTMKSFKQYIAESVKSYSYTIKIAGDVDKNFLDLFKYNLNKFEPIKISDPVRTPIQKEPYGFANLTNQPVTIIKAEFRYPATEVMIQQISQLLGYNLNMVRVVSSNFDDSINSEQGGYANQADHNPLLNHTELEEQPGAKEAAKAYGDSYLSSIKKQAEGSEVDIPYATKKTPDAFDPFKPYLPDDKAKNSPMSKIKLPPKPKTGAMA